eukprot:GFUD01020411.1.p1 GENE.GFUD01020411.1~~GFUD01020411.1.p1  ORF type:complete len:263 (-),score=48.44 GFUD01020411.1:371-1108(-)
MSKTVTNMITPLTTVNTTVTIMITPVTSMSTPLTTVSTPVPSTTSPLTTVSTPLATTSESPKENKQTKSPNKSLEQNNEVTIRELFTEAKAYKSHFSWSGFVTAILFGLAPSVWDVQSDFVFANKQHPYISRLSYLCISLPGIMLTVRGIESILSKVIAKCCPSRESSSKVFKYIFNTLTLVILSVGLYYLSTTSYKAPVPALFYYLSILSSTYILGIKCIAVIVQGPVTKNLAIKTSAAEGVYE